MRKIVLSIGFAFIAMGVFAQKAEIEATNKAFENKNYTTVLQNAKAIEAKKITDRTIEPEVLADYYKNVAEAAQNQGDGITSAKYYALLGNLENKKHYEAKNKDTREVEFFWDKAVAEKITSEGNYKRLRERDPETKHLSKVINKLNDKANLVLSEGNDAFNSKNYKLAGDKFLESFYLSSAIGNTNQLIKYYAALSYLQAKGNENLAADLLQNLIDIGYTGVETKYYAKVKGGDNEVAFASKEDLDKHIKLGLYVDPRIEKTPSIEEDLYSNATYAYYHTEQYDKGIEIVKKGLEKFPSNKNMNEMLSGMYYKSGNSKEFIADLQNKVKKGIASSLDYFNLAKLLEDQKIEGEETSNKAKAKEYYKKSIELDPSFASAYLNLGYNIVSNETPYVELMNSNLGTSKKEKKIYAENQAKRKLLYKEALPYLEKAYELTPDNLVIVQILRNTYDVLGNDEKFLKMKKILETSN